MWQFYFKLKGSLKSVTVWVNSIFLSLLPFYDDLRTSLPELQPYLPDDAYKKMVFALVILNIVLRFRTKVDLKDKA